MLRNLSSFFLLTLLLCACGEKIGPGTTEPVSAGTVKAETAVAEISSQSIVYEALGTITAQNSSTLSGKIMGTVKAVNVKEGDAVKQGDVLVVLDARQVDAGLQQAEAGLSEAKRAESAAVSARDSARAGAKLAESTYKRYQKLLKENSASRQEFDEVEARYRQAQAALAQAEAMVAAAKSRVQQADAATSSAGVSQKDASILAPYDGIITAKMIDAGALAAPGTPFLTIEKTGGFQADLLVPEYHIQAVHTEQEVEVSIPSLGDTLRGTVKTIVPSADRMSRSFTVKVMLPEDDPKNSLIRSGMFARVSIPVGEGGILLIPQSALVYRGQLTGFFLVDGKNIARFRLVRTGRQFGDKIEVISGLKTGTRYVTNPPAELRDGLKVGSISVMKDSVLATSGEFSPKEHTQKTTLCVLCENLCVLCGKPCLYPKAEAIS
ncbi:MAG: efflux RND transporter periplasmic adaptor subunit [Desulfococcaceae bacterium]